MILEAARSISAWLGHATYGVNALLVSTIPRDGTDALPVVASITDEFTDERASVGRVPVLLPSLTVDVFAADVIENQVVQDQGDGQVVVRIRYGTASADAAVAKREGSYVIRAVAMSLRVLARQAHEASRTRNSVRLRPAQNGRVEVRPYLEVLEDRLVTAMCVATYDFRDYLTLPT